MNIAFFDSGLGGFLMMNSIRKKITKHSYTYVGDTKNVPYGPRKPLEVLNYTEPILLSLMTTQDVVVVACNTACVKALPLFIQKYPQYKDRIINIAELTLKKFQNTKIDSVLATLGTVKSGFYDEICAPSRQIAMPGLVDVIEAQDMLAGLSSVDDVIAYSEDTKKILLGCTHYLWLKDSLLQKYPNIDWIGQDDILLEQIKLFAEDTAGVEYYVTGDHGAYSKLHNVNFRKYKNH